MEIPIRSFIWVSGVHAKAIDHLFEEFSERSGHIQVDAYNQVIKLRTSSISATSAWWPKTKIIRMNIRGWHR